MVQTILPLSLSQQHCATEGNTIYVTDTAVGALKMITPTNSLNKFLELLDVLYKFLGCT